MRIIGGDHRLKAFLDGEVVVRKERTYETDRITVQSKQISNVPIHLSIYSPNVVNLTLIDLPGLTKVAVEGQSETIVEDVEMMVHSYVEKADNVSEGKHVSAFGLLSGVVSAATVCGTLAAQFLPTARIYQVAAVLVVLAAVYLKIFLKETSRVQIDSALEEPILKSIDQSSEAKESFY